MEKMSRRLVNLVLLNSIGCRPGSSLYRINPWSLFYPTTRHALDAAASAANNKAASSIESARLPRAAMSFYLPCPPDGDSGEIDFTSLGGSSNGVISMDQDGNTLLYEAAYRAVRVLPSPHEPKISPVSLAIGDSLYLLNNIPGLENEEHPFEALHYKNSSGLCGDDRWHWRSLPPPPFVIDYYGQSLGVDDDACSSCHQDNKSEIGKSSDVIEAYTVVGESKIWVSTQVGVTHAFDTASGVWSNAGEWPLPFHGSTKYAPEHGLWFGFSPQGWQFAAADLGAASTMTPPVLHKAWDERVPKHWIEVMTPYLLPLGSGKFCIGRVFNMGEEGRPQGRGNGFRPVSERFAVFTGVEVERRGSRGALRLVKHKSKRFSFGCRMVHAIL